MRSCLLHIAIIFVICFLIKLIKGQGLESSICGTRVPEFNALITNGFHSHKHWPWHAAIYHIVNSRGLATSNQQNVNSVYQCGGSLITSKSVLTAAHCVCNYDEAMDPKNVFVSLGKLNLGVNESTSQSFKVSHLLYRLIWSINFAI